MTELTKFQVSGLPVDSTDLIKNLQNVNDTIQNISGVPFLRLLKSGIFAYGPENIEPEPDSEWAVNPYSIMHGFACWVDSELMGETMVPFNQPLPPIAELPDYGGDWNQQIAVTLQCLTGDDQGTNVMYKVTSKGALQALKTLITEIVNQASIDSDKVVPIITLESDSYPHKKYGQIYFPVFDIVRWITMEGVVLEEEEEEEEIEEEIEVVKKKETAEAEPAKRKTSARRRRR